MVGARSLTSSTSVWICIAVHVWLNAFVVVGAGHEYMAVVPNGDIYPCHQFVGKDGYVLGNV